MNFNGLAKNHRILSELFDEDWFDSFEERKGNKNISFLDYWIANDDEKRLSELETIVTVVQENLNNFELLFENLATGETGSDHYLTELRLAYILITNGCRVNYEVNSNENKYIDFEVIIDNSRFFLEVKNLDLGVPEDIDKKLVFTDYHRNIYENIGSAYKKFSRTVPNYLFYFLSLTPFSDFDDCARVLFGSSPVELWMRRNPTGENEIVSISPMQKLVQPEKNRNLSGVIGAKSIGFNLLNNFQCKIFVNPYARNAVDKNILWNCLGKAT